MTLLEPSCPVPLYAAGPLWYQCSVDFLRLRRLTPSGELRGGRHVQVAVPWRCRAAMPRTFVFCLTLRLLQPLISPVPCT